MHALAIDPNDAQKLYAWVMDKRLYRSRNGGEIWVPVEDGRRFAMSFSAAEVGVSAGSRRRFWVTRIGLVRGPADRIISEFWVG